MIPLGVLSSAQVAAGFNLPVTDTFDRANGALGSADTGQPWRTVTGSPVISSNKAQSSNGAVAVAVVDVDAADVSVSAVVTKAASGYPSLVARLAPNGSAYYAQTDTLSYISLWIIRSIGGSEVVLASGTQSFTSGTLLLTVKEEVGGTRLTLFFNGVQKAQYLDTNSGRPPSGAVGVRLEGSTTFDNFSAEAI